MLKRETCTHPCHLNCTHTGRCPPCRAIVQKMCAGDHTVLPAVFCSAPASSCGRPCGRELSCGEHSCNRSCHDGPCLPLPVSVAALTPVSKSEYCTQLCGRKRAHCDHSCTAPCHPKTPCPDSPCTSRIIIACACGRITKSVVCGITSAAVNAKSAVLGATSAAAILFPASRNVPELSQPNAWTSLDCDEKCEVF